MKRKRFLAVACAAAMIASMTTGLAVNVSAADEKSDFAGEELSILVSAFQHFFAEFFDSFFC